MIAPFNPVVFHIIRTTASGGARIKRDWLQLARAHEVVVKMRFLFVQAGA